MRARKPILLATRVRKDYAVGRGWLPVLKGIDLQVYEGEIIAIVGPSGVGKSTLLHILGTLDRPTAGGVEIDSVDVFSFNDGELARFRNKTIGFVFQFHHLLPEFTAVENVAMPALIGQADYKGALQRALSLLREVGLEDRSQHRPSELSGGEQQRVAVARALMNQPQLVLADEPSGNLDLAASESLHRLLWSLSRQRNQTFIIVTHNLDVAKQADRIIELYDGRVKLPAESGPSSEYVDWELR